MLPTKLVRVDHRSPIPLAAQVAQQLVWLIASGQIKQDDKLPSVRALANHLGVAIHTVQVAYQQLEAAGLVETRRGSGTRLLPSKRRSLSAITSDLATWTIGVLIPEYSPFYGPFLRGLQESAREISSLLFICDTQEYGSSTTSYLDQLVAKSVDGIVVTSFVHADNPLWRAALGSPAGLPPLVFADSPGMPGPGVLFDLEDGAVQAARHIAQHGHHRIGAVLPPLSWTNVEPILRGYRQGLAQDGLHLDDSLVATGPDFSPASGALACTRLLDRPQPPTALLVASETLAIGVIRTLKERGLSIPGDVALVGFGDMEVASVLDPALTTVALPAYDMGLQAMAMLRQRLVGTKVRPRLVTIASHLVVRRSCGCGQEPGG
jgi:DNA-binding LacI/PurR family transcriptional regulator